MKAIIEKNGLTNKISTGYSFKSLFFGVLYPAARGDFKGFIIQLVLALLTGGLSWLIVPFTYNKIYLGRMISKGWHLTGVKGGKQFGKNGVIDNEEIIVKDRLPRGMYKGINSKGEEVTISITE